MLSLFLLNCTNEFEINDDSYSLGVQDFIWTDFDREDSYYGGVRIVNTRVWHHSYSSDSSLFIRHLAPLRDALFRISNLLLRQSLKFVFRRWTFGTRESIVVKSAPNNPYLLSLISTSRTT